MKSIAISLNRRSTAACGRRSFIVRGNEIVGFMSQPFGLGIKTLETGAGKVLLGLLHIAPAPPQLGTGGLNMAGQMNALWLQNVLVVTRSQEPKSANATKVVT